MNHQLAAVIILLAVASGVVIAARHFFKTIDHQTKKQSKKKTKLQQFADTYVEQLKETKEGTMAEVQDGEDPLSVQRLNAVNKIVEGIRESYPDAKRVHVDIDFNFAESGDTQENELCPQVKIDIER